MSEARYLNVYYATNNRHFDTKLRNKGTKNMELPHMGYTIDAPICAKGGYQTPKEDGGPACMFR